MMTASPVLADRLWNSANQNKWIRYGALMVIGSLLIALSAQIKVPMYPVPMSMQTFAVLLIGALYGSRLGAATVILYLLEGTLGLPVFAGGAAGLAVLKGYTAGYLVGFVFAAAAIGFLVERGLARTPIPLGLSVALGITLVFAFGVSWLAGFIGLEKAILGGLVPFILGDLLKGALVVAVVTGTMKALNRQS